MCHSKIKIIELSQRKWHNAMGNTFKRNKVFVTVKILYRKQSILALNAEL